MENGHHRPRTRTSGAAAAAAVAAACGVFPIVLPRLLLPWPQLRSCRRFLAPTPLVFPQVAGTWPELG